MSRQTLVHLIIHIDTNIWTRFILNAIFDTRFYFYVLYMCICYMIRMHTIQCRLKHWNINSKSYNPILQCLCSFILHNNNNNIIEIGLWYTFFFFINKIICTKQWQFQFFKLNYIEILWCAVTLYRRINDVISNFSFITW